MDKLIGKLDNKWRRRYVNVYEIAGEPAHVKTVGIPYDIKAEPVVCIEPRSSWESVIAAFPNTAVYE